VNEGFIRLFGRKPDAVGEAPGRVNLIGEHTDYSGGYVLPLPIALRTTIAVARRRDQAVCVASAKIGAQERRYMIGDERPEGDWLDYVKGITCVLAADGRRVDGFDALIQSTIPMGAGLASSAAMEIGLLRALRRALGLDLDDLALARLAHRAENEFVGARVGIMDQLAASVGREGEALFIDTRTLSNESLRLPPAGIAVIHSGVAHGHAGGEYNLRRSECEDAARALGVPQLRDVAPSDLPRVEALPEPLRRRAHHVVTENERVLRAIDALRAGDLPRLGQLFAESHRSMRDDYEVSTPEVDALVELAAKTYGVFGARLTGGGFGGCVVVLTEPGRALAIGASLAAEYRRRTGKPGHLLLPNERVDGRVSR
jgi:galactokinase